MAWRMWLFPVPDLPVTTRSSWRRTNSRLASSTMKDLSRPGWKAQSKASSVLRSRSPLRAMRRSTRRSSLKAASAPRTCSSNAPAPGFSRVAQARCSSRRSWVRVRPRSWRCRRSRSMSSSGFGGCLRPDMGLLGALRGERVVLVEVAQAGVVALGLVEPAGALLGDVLGEPARGRARGQDARHGGVLEGAEGAGVAERGGEVARRVALSQEENLPGVVAGEAALGRGEPGEETPSRLADGGEGHLQLIQVSAAAVPPGLVGAGRDDVVAGAARGQLSFGHQLEVSRVDEELVLGDADGEDVGDVVIRDGVAVAV